MIDSTPSDRIALFSNALPMGGAERIMIGIAESLVEAGYDVDLVLAERRGELLQQVPTAVRIVELESASRATVLAALPGFPWSSILDLGRLAIRNRLILKLPSFATYLREEAPCALLVTVSKNSLLALWARHLAGVDLRLVVREANVHSLQHAGRSRDNPILIRLARKWYPHADTFVAIFQGVATDLTHSLGIPAGRISTIHNPVDADNVARLASTPIDHPWLRADIPLLLSVGRLAQQKDHATLLRAFAIVRREREVRLLVLGEGSCRRELEKLSCELDVERDVSFPGITSNPYPFMASASCFVLSSAWEGFGNVLIEALPAAAPSSVLIARAARLRYSTAAASGGWPEREIRLIWPGRLSRPSMSPLTANGCSPAPAISLLYLPISVTGRSS